MGNFGEHGRVHVERESIPLRDHGRTQESTSISAGAPRTFDLLRIQREAGNRAAVGLVQRMQEVLPAAPPKTIQPIPGKGTVDVWNPEKKVPGKITEAFARKLISLDAEAALKDPHLKHWWFLFKVTPDAGPPVWMQADLNLREGYRIIWGASKNDKEDIRYEPAKFPSELTSTDVESAITRLAVERQMYYNPTPPDPTYPRYSCQDFVQILAERLGIAL
jgi:hypothetical protein